MGRARFRTIPMPNDASSARIIDLERSVLRALCARSNSRSRWARIDRELAGYVWQEPDYAVIYGALQRVRSRDPKILRDQLPAEVTRMGFPDLDWAICFASDEASEGKGQLNELILQLKAAAGKP